MVIVLNMKFCRLLGVSFHPKEILRIYKFRSLLKFDFKMAAMRCFFAIKINLHLMQCMLCGQYILADRFLRNSGYLVEGEVLSIFGVSFYPKEVLKNLKIRRFLKFDFKIVAFRCFFAIKINPLQCIICGQ